jgi:hypothetical protein
MDGILSKHSYKTVPPERSLKAFNCSCETCCYGNWCSGHKCKLCENLKLEWSKFCSKCICPEETCASLACACNRLCLCCCNKHMEKSVITCEACKCVVCQGIPKIRGDNLGYLGVLGSSSGKFWGQKLLCVNHKTCLVNFCPNDIDEFSIRYCDACSKTIPSQIYWVSLVLNRMKVDKNIIKIILRFYRWKAVNRRLCIVCKDKYVGGLRCGECTKTYEEKTVNIPKSSLKRKTRRKKLII